LQPPRRAAVSPNLTPFTQRFPHLDAQSLKSLASTDFATRATDALVIVQKRRHVSVRYRDVDLWR
jgi:hypothetical protein